MDVGKWNSPFLVFQVEPGTLPQSGQGPAAFCSSQKEKSNKKIS